MEHKVYTIDIVLPSEEEKNKVQVGIITTTDGKITAVSSNSGIAEQYGWVVGRDAPHGDVFIPTIKSSE
tara:strand:+ start:739 stop:945 length:207 start_codon:yes stop_codon:yes gene_type:complete